jgi:curved DNA-binding protein CbpA
MTDVTAQELHDRAQKLLALDHFAVLGIARTASREDVKRAFIEAVKTWHPDRVPRGLEAARPLFVKVFGRLEQARATLSDPERRARYVEDLARPSGTTAATASDVSSAEAALEFRKAEGLLKKHDLSGAEQHLRRAVQLAPGNVEFQVALVGLKVKPDLSLDRARGLITDLDRLLERDPTSARAYFYRGQLRKRLEQTKQAMDDFARAAQLDPRNVDAAREVRLYRMRQDRDDAGAGAAKGGGASGGAVGFFKKLFNR